MGWLLLDIVIDNKRRFDLREGYTYEHKWTGEEANI